RHRAASPEAAPVPETTLHRPVEFPSETDMALEDFPRLRVLSRDGFVSPISAAVQERVAASHKAQILARLTLGSFRRSARTVVHAGSRSHVRQILPRLPLASF